MLEILQATLTEVYVQREPPKEREKQLRLDKITYRWSSKDLYHLLETILES
jgi:hypothetical protein